MNERLTYTVEEAAKVLGISRPTAYMAIQDSKIPHIRIGRRILIPKVALTSMLNNATENSDNAICQLVIPELPTGKEITKELEDAGIPTNNSHRAAYRVGMERILTALEKQ